MRNGANPLVVGWEQAVLGTAIAEPMTMEEAGDLRPSDFSIESHQLLWTEILALHQRGALELRALIESLRSGGLLEQLSSVDGDHIGEAFIAEVVSRRGSAMREYAGRVLDASIKRQLRSVAALIRADADDERVEAQEAMDSAERRLLGLRRASGVELGTPLAEILAVFNSRIEGFRSGAIQPAWVPRIDAIRSVIGYIDQDDFVLVAARPGDGKSSLLRYDFVKSALEGEPVLIFNLENGELEYAKFAISMVTEIDSERLKDPRRLSEEELACVRSAAERLSRAPLFVKTMGAPSAREIERITRLHIMRHNIRRVGVDYIQLVRNGIDSKVLDVSESSGVLRAIALNLGIPVMANSQMSRQIVHRGENAIPQLSDLRESGSLEQDATMVWFPRPVWAEPTEGQLRMFPDNVNPATRQLYPTIRAIPVRVYIQKNRNGPTGVTEPMLWRKHVNQFRTLTALEDR